MRTGHTRTLRRFALALAAALAAGSIPGGKAWANGNVVRLKSEESASVRVAKGKPLTVKTEAPYQEIVVGDPGVADVSPLTNKSFYILGLDLGTTSLALFDADKQMVGSIEVEVTLDTEQLADTIKQAVPDADIDVSSANGRLVLSGSAEDAVAAERAAAIAERFSGEEKIINSVDISSSQQVQLNVRFVEINRQVGQELGTQIRAAYVTGSGGIAFNAAPESSSNFPAGQLIGSLLSGGFSIDVAIEALEKRGVARRLAEPNLIARSGETASFLAGGEFPIPVAQNDDKITVDYKKYGVSLDFTPVVLKDGLISLEIEPEVSAIDPSASYQVGDLSIPGFIVRRAKTSVDLKSGQSFMMAGLLQSQNDLSTSRVPGLGKLPILGALFSSKSYQRRETDLVIIVTPHLVKPIDPEAKPVAPTDLAVAGSHADYFLGDVEEVAAAGSAADFGHILELPEQTK